MNQLERLQNEAAEAAEKARAAEHAYAGDRTEKKLLAAQLARDVAVDAAKAIDDEKARLADLEHNDRLTEFDRLAKIVSREALLERLRPLAKRAGALIEELSKIGFEIQNIDTGQRQAWADLIAASEFLSDDELRPRIKLGTDLRDHDRWQSPRRVHAEILVQDHVGALEFSKKFDREVVTRLVRGNHAQVSPFAEAKKEK